MKITPEERKKGMELFLPVARIAVDRGISYHVARFDFAVALMHEALKDNDGNLVDAALSLGINKNWAYRLVGKGNLRHMVKNQTTRGRNGQWQPRKNKTSKTAKTA